jgi:hypothetical protein
MDRVFSGLEFVRCYIDDIFVFSTSKKKHRVHLTEVFARLRLHGLKLHLGKCKFYCDRIEYLGLGMVASKVEVVMSIPRPRDVSRLRAFLGLCNYSCKFVKTFSAIAKPLTMLTRSDQPWIWGDEQEAAFGQLKDRLASAPILRRPIARRMYQLHTDWSTLGIGAVLTQMDDDGKHVEEGEDSLPGWHCSAFLCLLAMNGDTTEEATVATVDEDDGEESGGAKDIFEDVDVMKYLKDGEVKVTWSTKKRDRVLKHAKQFVWERTHLLRLWPDGTKKVVPAPEERVKLIKHAYEDLGHFGMRRTYNLLQIHYWWRGMQQQVQAMVAQCVVCDRVRASFNAPMPQLQPLPIMGLGYR